MQIRETTPGGKISKPRFEGEMSISTSATLSGGAWDDKLKRYVGGGKPKVLDFTFYDAERKKDARITLRPDEIRAMAEYLDRLEAQHKERLAQEAAGKYR